MPSTPSLPVAPAGQLARARGATTTPTIRRRYQSLATASVSGSAASAAACGRGADRRLVQRPAGERGLGGAPPGRGCGPRRRARPGRRSTDPPSRHEPRGDRHDRRRVLQAAAELDERASRPGAMRDDDRRDELVRREGRRHEAGEERLERDRCGCRRARSPRPRRRAPAARSRRRRPRGAENRLPPTVAMLRTAQLAVRRAAVASSGTVVLRRERGERRRRADAQPAVARARCRPCPARRRPITRVGRVTPSLTSGIATVPPARTSRSGPCAPSSPTASATEVGRK